MPKFNQTALSLTATHSCNEMGGVLTIQSVILGESSTLVVRVKGSNDYSEQEIIFPGHPLPYITQELGNGAYDIEAVDEFGYSALIKVNGQTGISDFIVDCAPSQPASDLTLELETENPTTLGGTEGSVTFIITGSNGPFKTRIGVLELETGKVFYDGLSAGDYVAYVEDALGNFIKNPFTLVGPPPVYHVGPEPKYLAVGGVLSNEINYHFNFNLFDELGNRKESHYVQLDLYQEDETQPFASTRARLKDALATVDVSRYVRNIVKIAPQPSAGMISPDNTAMKRFHVKYQEYAFGVAVGEEVTTEEKYAVNAALQDLQNNDYSEFVIFE